MYIGVDVGGTNLAIGIVNENGDLVNSKSHPTHLGGNVEIIVDDIVNMILQIINENEISIDNIKGIGIGIPGLYYPRNETVDCVNLYWEGVPLKKLVEDRLNKPVYIDNDASVAALAEFEVGSLKNSKNSVLLTIGTGLGGGIIINEKLYSGSNGVASEIGHIVVGENFYDCNCGKNGCLETFVSSTAIIKYTKKLIEEREVNTSILSEVDNNLDLINAKVIFECALKGDYIADLAVKRLARYLGIGIGNIINIIDPEIISLGGGVSRAGEYLLRLVRNEVDKNILFTNASYSKITLAQLGNEAGIIGAAMLCKY